MDHGIFSPKYPLSAPQESPPPFHPIIQTPRLLLRSPVSNDTAAIHLIRTHPKVAEWHNSSNATDPVSDTEAWLTRIFVPEKTFSFVIQLLFHTASGNNVSGSGPVIGVLSMTINPKTSFPTIGYFISPEYWSKGYLTEAISASLAEYWELYPNGLPGSRCEGKDGRVHVDATVISKNVGSVRVLEKCGFELVAYEEVEDWHGGPNILLDRYRFWKPNDPDQ
ncbi:acyl-CoA N-acyltransferase [Stipitochalara longipes BDJ]|nr:acyl-CoA N-acyltransferase [Stipitochalara longipes BDJ]